MLTQIGGRGGKAQTHSSRTEELTHSLSYHDGYAGDPHLSVALGGENITSNGREPRCRSLRSQPGYLEESCGDCEKRGERERREEEARQATREGKKEGRHSPSAPALHPASSFDSTASLPPSLARPGCRGRPSYLTLLYSFLASAPPPPLARCHLTSRTRSV